MKMYSAGSIRPVASHGDTAVVIVTDANGSNAGSNPPTRAPTNGEPLEKKLC